MFARRRAHHAPKGGDRHKISQEQMGDDQREHRKPRVLGPAPDYLGRGPAGGIELSAGHGIAFDPTLQSPVNLFKEHRLRAGPAAPDPAEERGQKKEQEASPAEHEEQQPHVLRGGGPAEEMEPARRGIQEHRRKTADLDPRQRQIKNDEPPARDPPQERKAAGAVGGMQEEAGAVGPDGRDGIKRRRGARGRTDGCRGHGRRAVLRPISLRERATPRSPPVHRVRGD